MGHLLVSTVFSQQTGHNQVSSILFILHSFLGRLLGMNFPVAGAPPAVAAWLRTQLFKEDIIEIFDNWDADAMLNVSEMDLKEEVPGREGKRLWALLTSTKNAQGQYLTTTNIPIESLRTCVTTLCLGRVQCRRIS